MRGDDIICGMKTICTHLALGVLVLSAVLLSGCGKKREPLLNPDGTTNLAAVAFAVVNGEPLTAAFVRDTVLVRMRIMELAKERMPKNDREIRMNNAAMRAVPSLVATLLLDRELRTNGPVPTAEDEAKALENYRRLTKTKVASKDELCGLFGDLSVFFRNQFERECRLKALYRTKDVFSVSEDEVEASYAILSNQLRHCQQLTEKGKKRGLQAWQKLNAGVSWEAVAKEFNEDALMDPENVDYWKEWGTFALSDMGLEPVREALATLAVGKYSMPLDTDEGLIIVKLDGREGQKYKCSRILIRLGGEVDIPSRAVIEAQVRAEKSHDAQREILKRLRKTAKIEYPLGTNFIYNIWAPPKGARKFGI